MPHLGSIFDHVNCKPFRNASNYDNFFQLLWMTGMMVQTQVLFLKDDKGFQLFIWRRSLRRKALICSITALGTSNHLYRSLMIQYAVSFLKFIWGYLSFCESGFHKFLSCFCFVRIMFENFDLEIPTSLSCISGMECQKQIEYARRERYMQSKLISGWPWMNMRTEE